MESCNPALGIDRYSRYHVHLEPSACRRVEWEGLSGQLKSLSTELTGAAIMISNMSVAGPGSCLCVAGSWQDCVVDVSIGDRVMTDLKQCLLQIAAEG